MKVLWSTPDLVLRALEDRDIPLLARWRSDRRVMDSYAVLRGRVSAAQVRSLFFRDARSRDPATGRFYEYRSCIVEERGTPVAFVQYHRLRTSDAQLLGRPSDEHSYEVDLFVGEPELWGKGLGSKIIALTRDHLRSHRGAVRIVAVPYADNARSIRAFEKAGFRRARTLPGAYAAQGRGDGVLMEFP